MDRTNIKLGIFGFGCVGQGLWNVLSQTRGIRAEIVKICIKHPDKPRPIGPEWFTTDPALILNNPDINVVVELISDADAAFSIVSEAMKKGKAVVTANKKMVAEHATELYELQQQYGTPLLYEAACAASIPIIRNLEEYYDNDLLTAVEGIFNGSTNYILSRIFRQGESFEAALLTAQNLGFAEADPSLDVDGFDPKFKLSIVLLHAFGIFAEPGQIFNFGIGRLNGLDIRYARQQGKTIKLLAVCRKSGTGITAFCMPAFVDETSHLAAVHNENNGILVEGVFSEQQFFAGKGAGSNPTGSAVLSDISALTYGYRYEYKKLHQQIGVHLTDDLEIDVYLRFADWTAINMADFVTISQRYASSDGNWLTGQINLGVLRKASWLKNPGVNVVWLGHSARQPEQPAV